MSVSSGPSSHRDPQKVGVTDEELKVFTVCVSESIALSTVSSVLFHRLLNNFLNNAQGGGQIFSKVKRFQSVFSLVSTVLVFMQVNRQYYSRVCKARLLSLPPSQLHDIMSRRRKGEDVGPIIFEFSNGTEQSEALKENYPNTAAESQHDSHSALTDNVEIPKEKGEPKNRYISHDEKEEATYTRDKQVKYTYVPKKERSEDMYKPLNKYGDVVDDADSEKPKKQESNVTDGHIKRNKYGDIIYD